MLNDYARKQKFLKDDDANLTGDDVREGLVAVISVKLPEPQFEGQTKTRLGNAEVKTHVESAVAEGLMQYLEEHPSDGRRIIEKGIMASRAREAARKARDLVVRKGLLDGTMLPGKLADCSRARRRQVRAVPRRGNLGRRHREDAAATAASRRSCRCAARS